nr:FIVAR domain-containing protein [Lachnospiraceae bacterium]
MHRKVRQYLKKSLCGILSAAMILTSLSVPDRTVRAAEVSAAEDAERTDETTGSDETMASEDTKTSEETEESGETKAPEETKEAEEAQDTTILDETKEQDDIKESEETVESTTEASGREEADTSEKTAQNVSEVEEEEKSNGKALDAEEDKGTVGDETNQTSANLLQNGDFEAERSEENNNWFPPAWTVSSAWDAGFKADDKVGTGYGNSVSWWLKSGSESKEVSISQTVDNVSAGSYKIALDVAGLHPAKTFNLIVEQTNSSDEREQLVKLDLGESVGWSEWRSVNTYFNVLTAGSLSVSIGGIIGEGGQEQKLVLDNIILQQITLDLLSSLVEKADNLEESEYTAASWASFQTALSNAKDVVNNGDSSGLADAYKNLSEAMENLEKESPSINIKKLQDLLESSEVVKIVNNGENTYTADSWKAFNDAKMQAQSVVDANSSNPDYTSDEVTKAYTNLQSAIENMGVISIFYYYNDSIAKDDELGLVFWKSDRSYSTAGTTDWHVWNEGDTYAMIGVEGYPGWYSIPMVLMPTPAEEYPGFEIHKKSDITNAVETYDKNNYPTVSDSAAIYAVKNDKYYWGEELVKSLMRKITLYVYDESGTPAVGSESELSVVNETTGEIDKIHIYNTADNINYYDMTPDADNWYTLTFSAPDAEKVCDLYTKGTDNNYTFAVSFTNGETSSENAVDFTPVFDGSIYYNNGGFYKSKELATGVSLADLDDLYKKAEALEETRYTEESWAVLTDKMAAAKRLIDENSSDVEAITTAFDELNSAIENLVSSGIRFYYYVGDTEGKKVGVYHWSNNHNISSTAVNNDWIFWETPMFEMTPAEYPGWYSVPLTFAGNVEDSANFQILVEGSETPLFKCGSEINPDNGGNETIYQQLFAMEQTTYAVKEFGEGDTKTTKLYEGLDSAQTAMRNITLYAYSETGTPAIGSSVELSALNERTGELPKLTASKTEGSVHYYNMTAEATSTEASEEEISNWYKLTFSMPVFEENTDIGIYTLADETYTIDKKFADKDTEGLVNIAPVFGGSVYYREGQLYKTKEEAAGITLGQLQQYLESDEVTAIVRNGEGMYTAASWEKFQSAKTKADELVSKIEANGEGYKDAETTAAYSALKEAVENMVSTGKVINLYYYSEALNEVTDTDTEKYGLYLSVWNNQKVSSTREEIQLSQGDWSYNAYALEKVTDEAVNYGYDNWYSVPVKLIAANDGADGDGFLIQTGKAVTAEGVTTHTALAADTGLIKISYWENKAIYDSMSALDNGGTIAIKGTDTYASIYEAENVTIDKLLALYQEAAAFDEKDYLKGEQWDAFQAALA